ncbi:MAG: hypothetical protein M5R41_18815 [Bacteroidia bacterium]|nr:hypothetical protein [Bacteroidia bacterium]
MKTKLISIALLVAGLMYCSPCFAQMDSAPETSTSAGTAELTAGIAASTRGAGPTFGLSLGSGMHAAMAEYRHLAKAPGIPYQVSLEKETYTEFALLYRIRLGDENTHFHAAAGAAIILEKRLGKFIRSSMRTESSSHQFLWWRYSSSKSIREDYYEVASYKSFGAALDLGVTMRMRHWCCLGVSLHGTRTKDRGALSGNLTVILGDFR